MAIAADARPALMDNPDIPERGEAPAFYLSELSLDNGWTVKERVPRDPGATGGHFSVGYFATHVDGTRGFLKALDLARAIGDEDNLTEALERATRAYHFERDLLLECGNRRLTRVLRLLAHGQVRVPGGGLLARVPYLIFELAEGDIRYFWSQFVNFDYAWALRVLHHSATGLAQLHSVKAAHQDLKPSNIMTQSEGKQMKLGDLGCAERREASSPRAHFGIPGAFTYAPPEQLYGEFTGTWEERRAGDLYLLGSLGVNLFLGHSLTALIVTLVPYEILPPPWGTWQGSFDDAIPALQQAHAEVLHDLNSTVQQAVSDPRVAADLTRALRELTAPDPQDRGHPRNRRYRVSSYGLQQYISIFNRLATTTEFLMKGKL